MLTALLAATAEAHASHGPVGDFAEQFGIEWNYLLWQLGSFTLLAVVLYWFGIRPLLATMDSRNARIEEGLKFAEDIKVKLAEAEKSAEAKLAAASAEAATILGDARKNAEARIAASVQDAIAASAAVQKKAEESIALERAKMLAEVRAEVAKLVVATSAKVLSRELGADEKSRYAEAAAKELSVR